MARFYSNENVALPLVTALRGLGHDVRTSFDAGNANSATPDQAVLAFSTSESRILLTHNRRHFLRLHDRRTTDHEGMILLTFDPDFVAQAMRTNEAIRASPEMRNQVIRVNRKA